MNATVLIILALSALSTLVVGEFDLSFGSVMGISASTVAIVGGEHHQQRSSGSYLLPALAAVFLSTAVSHPGMFNPIAAVIAIFFLPTGIIALQLMGSSAPVVGLSTEAAWSSPSRSPSSSATGRHPTSGRAAFDW